MNAIEVKQLNKSFTKNFSFKKTQVLYDLSFNVESNKVTGFLGANGAGKTTTFKIMMGLLMPDNGEVLINGKAIDFENKKQIGFMPERPAFPDHLNAQEFLSYLCRFHKLDDLKTKIPASLELVGLRDVGSKLIKDFSKGMVQRLGLAQAIIHSPEVVILDEPMSGLDPNGRRDLMRIITDIASTDKTVFMSSHLLDDIQRLCDDIVLIQEGKLIFNGSIAEIQSKISAEYRLIYIKEQKKIEKLFNKQADAEKFLAEQLQLGATILEFTPHKSFESAVMELQKNE